MPCGPVDDLGITMDELRAVVRFALESAEPLLAVFEAEHGHDERPRAAVDAARLFVDGQERSRLQRVTSLDAHRAARDATGELARCAAHAAGDAAAAAYLHPPLQVAGWASQIARETQVGHILRPAAHAARVAELLSDDERSTGHAHIERTYRRSPSDVADIVGRYPPIAERKGRITELMVILDSRFRTGRKE